MLHIGVKLFRPKPMHKNRRGRFLTCKEQEMGRFLNSIAAFRETLLKACAVDAIAIHNDDIANQHTAFLNRDFSGLTGSCGGNRLMIDHASPPAKRCGADWFALFSLSHSIVSYLLADRA